MRFIVRALAIVLVALSARVAMAQSFTLDVASTATQDVALTVQTPTTLSFKIIRSGIAPTANVSIDVTPFTNEQGVARRVTLSVAGAAGNDLDHVAVPFPDTVLPVGLRIPDLPTGGKYTGRLILSSGQAAPLIWRFVLTSANETRPATLVTDKSAETIAVVRPWCLWGQIWCGGGSAPALSVHVRDKSGNWPLEGVTARLEPGLKTPGSGFDFKRQISAKFNGEAVADVFSSAVTGTRRVDPRGQGTLELSFQNLEAGEYTIPLRVTAMNSTDDELQRLTLTVQVRNNLTTAVLVLLLAALMSFMATRVVTTMRQRGAFMARVQTMRPAWLGREPATLPVIWLRATLRLTEHLSRRYWLSGQNEIDVRLTAAASMLAVLDRVRQVRELIEAIPDTIIKRRAIWRLDEVIQKLPAAQLTDQDVTRFTQELDAFNTWSDPDLSKREAAYWADLLSAIRAQYSAVQLSSVPDQGRALAKSFLDLLATAIAEEPKPLNAKIATEEIFARLSLLWESRNHPEMIGEVVKLHGDAQNKWAPIDEVYKVVDGAWWKLIKDQNQTALTIRAPVASSLDPAEAYETILFRLDLQGDPGLLRSYLMQKKLTYQWTIDVLPSEGFGKWMRSKTAVPSAPVGQLVLTSTQPQVAQYSPQAGRLQAKVHISYHGEHGRTVEQIDPLPIVRSSTFGVIGASERADLIGLIAVLITSVLSGITIYALAPTFGSLKEYLALFTWGASLDQGKNFLQGLAAFNSTTPTAPANAPGAAPAPAKPPAAPPSGH